VGNDSMSAPFFLFFFNLKGKYSHPQIN